MAYEIKTFDDFNVGDKNSFTKTITETDVILFAGISGDFNPLHMNEEYAKTTVFKSRICHGMLVESLFGPAGAPFFGGASVYMGHTQKFKAPTRMGDTITAIVEVAEKIVEKKILKIHNYAVNQDGVVVIDGEATVKILK